jgi:hypothetical protein
VGEIFHDREALELLAIGAGMEQEVVGPDVVRSAQRPRSKSSDTAAWTSARQSKVDGATDGVPEY